MEAPPDRFRRLLEPVHERAVAFARCLCRSHADGDDLFQEAALRALTKLDGLRDDGAFRPWLYRVVISVHRNRSRRAFWRRFLQLGVGEAAESDPAHSGEHDYRVGSWSPDAALATRRVRAALGKLPAVQREAIVLFEVEGWQVDEIAAVHRVSSSAIKSRLARGRARLRALYEGAPASEREIEPEEPAADVATVPGDPR